MITERYEIRVTPEVTMLVDGLHDIIYVQRRGFERNKFLYEHGIHPDDVEQIKLNILNSEL
jgi:hypothetical protein